MSSSFNAVNPGTVENDRGDVSEVFVAPRVYTEWENFDEKPLKLRYILHAAVDGEGYKPVYRETPWLFTDNSSEQAAYNSATHGTTDRVPDSGRMYLTSKNSAFYNINNNGDYVDPNDGSQTVTPKIVLYKEGMSDYYDEASDYPDSAHWDGSSLGSDSGDYANGNYGVLGDTMELDSQTDGQSKTTTIHLRLITALLDYDSESVMQAEYPDYSGSAGYTYQRLINIAPNHPAISVAEASFDVTAANEQADSSSNANANAGAN
ncbi:hypothetical protein [Haloarcula amylovorans]|uniref:hypothetical protein n=1 Tax=Haloarcula amylovorans TaxID=2562280 RepID=UPI001FD7E69A|nr:hypothetical protein [Halomicroarcula amylolytica]